jgi:hypothetical protein
MKHAKEKNRENLQKTQKRKKIKHKNKRGRKTRNSVTTKKEANKPWKIQTTTTAKA